jgi:hypothetical protein
MPAVDNETGELIVQEYEVVRAGGMIETRTDGVGEHMTPAAQRAALIHAAWGNGILPAPGGLFRQPARAMALLSCFNTARNRSEERMHVRRKVG